MKANMMKRLMFVWVFIAVALPSIVAQDLIITKQNDSINCQITRYKDSNIYFTYMDGEEYKSTLIPNDDVKERKLGFFTEDNIPKEKILGFEEFQRLRFGLDFGIGLRTASVSTDMPSELQKYANDLRKGFLLGGELVYFFHRKLGVGIKGNWSKSSNGMNNIYIEDEDGNGEFGLMRDRISMVYIGPHFLSRHTYERNDNVFCFGIGMGYLSYKNDAVLIDSFVITGNTLGLTIDFTYDLALHQNSAISF